MEEDLPVADLADSFCPSLPLLVPPGARYLQHNDDGVTGSPEEEQNLYTRIEWALRRARHGGSEKRSTIMITAMGTTRLGARGGPDRARGCV